MKLHIDNYIVKEHTQSLDSVVRVTPWMITVCRCPCCLYIFRSTNVPGLHPS